jgi:hypothetical protein
MKSKNNKISKAGTTKSLVWKHLIPIALLSTLNANASTGGTFGKALKALKAAQQKQSASGSSSNMVPKQSLGLGAKRAAIEKTARADSGPANEKQEATYTCTSCAFPYPTQNNHPISIKLCGGNEQDSLQKNQGRCLVLGGSRKSSQYIEKQNSKKECVFVDDHLVFEKNPSSHTCKDIHDRLMKNDRKYNNYSAAKMHEYTNTQVKVVCLPHPSSKNSSEVYYVIAPLSRAEWACGRGVSIGHHPLD